MRFLPPPTFPFPQSAACVLLLSYSCLAQTPSIPENLTPTQTRLVLAQASPGAAVSSQAVATQPQPPTSARLKVPASKQKKPVSDATSNTNPTVVDPLLDLNRPRGCQLGLLEEQTLRCGEVEVFLPAGIYQQVKIVEGPQKQTATESVDLKPQAEGLGYIRYLADGKIKVNGEERSGGLDIGVRPSDQLPLRIWYKKFNPPDDATKALGFICPPIMIAAGAGAWSSGNTLIPDSQPKFTENRNYFLKEKNTRATPVSGDTDLYQIKPAEACPSGTLHAPDSPPSSLRSR